MPHLLPSRVSVRVLLALLFVPAILIAAEPTAKPSGPNVRPVLVADAKLPRVLLIGDSILGGYHAKAAELLRGKIGLDVWITPKHVGSGDLRAEMKTVFAEHAYDVVLFNDSGLHAWQPERIPEGKYEPLLRAHLANLREYAPKAKLVFATTTPMTTKTKPIEVDAEYNPVLVERNKVALKVMEENRVPVADFHGILAKKLDLAAGDRFHWTKPAYELLAQCAATQIAETLGLPPPPTNTAIVPVPKLETEPEKMALWPEKAPLGDNQFEEANAFITVHRPAAGKANGAAVVICPGGGYRMLVSGSEGHGIAQWLNQQGIAGIVLEYRLPQGRPLVPLLDAQRAMRTVRFNARQWNIDPGRIGIMGFSAGGHLAATAATHFDRGDAKGSDPIDRETCRPDFAVLVYPVISMGEKHIVKSREVLLGSAPKPELVELFSNEKQVTDKTPPVFLAHAKDDAKVSPEHSRMFFKALKAHHVAAEYLELPSGGHGLDGYKGPMWDAWQTKSLEWLRAQKFMPNE